METYMTYRWLTGAAAVALTVAGAFAAQAADLPTRKMAPSPIFVPPPFTWTGFYLGVNAGAVFSQDKLNSTIYTAGFPILSNYYGGNLGSGQTGFIGGGQAGYNYQTGSFVLGVETDFDGTTLSKSGSNIGAPFVLGGLNDNLTTTGSIRMNWLGTTRGRVGFVATPDNRLMIYGTGGVAYGNGKADLAVYDSQYGYYFNGEKSDTRVGYTVGGGVEYAVTNNVTIKGEYLYYNLGSTNAVALPNSFASVAFPGASVAAKATFQGSIVRAGVNYKF